MKNRRKGNKTGSGNSSADAVPESRGERTAARLGSGVGQRQ